MALCNVYSGGVARGTTVDEGYIDLYPGDTVTGTILNSGGDEYDYGAALGTVVNRASV